MEPKTHFGTVEQFLKLCKSKITNEEQKKLVVKLCVKKIFQIYKASCFNAYEALMTYKYDNASDEIVKQSTDKCLKEYYEFLIAFDLQPILCTQNPHNQIVYQSLLDTMKVTRQEEILDLMYDIVVSSTIRKEYSTAFDNRVINIVCTDKELMPFVSQIRQFFDVRHSMDLNRSEIEAIF